MKLLCLLVVVCVGLASAKSALDKKKLMKALEAVLEIEARGKGRDSGESRESSEASGAGRPGPPAKTGGQGGKRLTRGKGPGGRGDRGSGNGGPECGFGHGGGSPIKDSTLLFGDLALEMLLDPETAGCDFFSTPLPERWLEDFIDESAGTVQEELIATAKFIGEATSEFKHSDKSDYAEALYAMILGAYDVASNIQSVGEMVYGVGLKAMVAGTEGGASNEPGCHIRGEIKERSVFCIINKMSLYNMALGNISFIMQEKLGFAACNKVDDYLMSINYANADTVDLTLAIVNDAQCLGEFINTVKNTFESNFVNGVGPWLAEGEKLPINRLAITYSVMALQVDAVMWFEIQMWSAMFALSEPDSRYAKRAQHEKKKALARRAKHARALPYKA